MTVRHDALGCGAVLGVIATNLEKLLAIVASVALVFVDTVFSMLHNHPHSHAISHFAISISTCHCVRQVLQGFHEGLFLVQLNGALAAVRFRIRLWGPLDQLVLMGDLTIASHTEVEVFALVAMVSHFYNLFAVIAVVLHAFVQLNV